MDLFDHFILGELLAPGDNLDVVHIVETKLSFLLNDPGFSQFLYSNCSDNKKADAIVAFFKTRLLLEKNRPHNKGIKLDPYKVYCTLSSPNSTLSSREFYSAFSGFCSMLLSKDALNCNTKVLKAIQSILFTGDSAENIVLFLAEVLRNPATTYVPTSSLPKDSDLEFTRKYTYIDAKNQLMPLRNNILDALGAALTDFEYNDIPLENTSVLQLFASTVIDSLSINAPVMIIEPTPFLIKHIKGNNPFRNRKLVFILDNLSLVSLYSDVFKNTSFQFISRDGLESFLLVSSNVPSDVLMFGSHILENDTKQQYITLLLNCVRDMHSLFLLDSDYMIMNRCSSIRNQFSFMNLRKVWLFPDGIHHSTAPARKTLVQCEYGYIDKSTDVTISSFRLSDNGKYQCLLPYMFQACVSLEDNEPVPNFRKLFRDQLLVSQSKTSQTRNQASSYGYSYELKVYFTMSGDGTQKRPYRLSAYVREPENNRLKPPIIIGSKKSTKRISPENIDNWIENQYLSDETVKKSIIGAYNSHYINQAISLRSFVYLNDEWVKDLPGSTLEDLKIISRSFLGDLHLDMIFERDIEDFLNEDGQRKSIRLNLLQNLFDLAIQKGHCTSNPAKNIIRSAKGSHEDLNNIRTNLTRKNFTPDQFLKIYTILSRNTAKRNQKNLAAMVCLLMGLDANTVCALKWGDFSYIENESRAEFSFYRLCIQRQLCNDGSEIRPFTRKEQFRLLPCPCILSSLLIDYHTFLLANSVELSEEYVREMFIFSTPDSYGIYKPSFSPQKLREHIRMVIKKIHMPPEIVPIPDNKKGTIETNLAYYPGDLFRTNFDYYARHFGSFELGEVEYFLGVQASTTFSQYYCDYTNTKALFIIFTKLERILYKLLDKTEFSSTRVIADLDGKPFCFVTDPDTKNCTHIGITLDLISEDPAELVIDSKFGVNISVQNI